jgi:dinuclear metal center YbgI/SA1388 family protein
MEPVDTDVTGPEDHNDGDAPSDTAAAGTAEAPSLGDLLLAVEELWPESLAEDWDEVGLVAGHPSTPVTKVMFAVDPTLEVIEEAVDWGAELLITHHPLLLKGVTSVAATTAKGRAVHRLIESGTALLTVHTNGDSAVGGVSDVLADALGLRDVAPLTVAANGLPEEGIGRVGDLADAMTLGEFAARVFGILPSVAAQATRCSTRSGPATRMSTSRPTSGTTPHPKPGSRR